MTHALRFFGGADRRPGELAATTILPAAAKQFLRRRFLELFGITLILTMLGFAAALLSYSPGDPSLSNASPGPVLNLLGLSGAITADLALQLFGFAAYAPALTLFIWGWLLVRNRQLPRLRWRIPGLIVATVLIGAGLSAIAVADSWPLMTRMGGVAGTIVFDRTVLALSGVNIAAAQLGVGAVFALVGAIFWIPTFNLSLQEWRSSGLVIAAGTVFLGRSVGKSRRALGVVPAWSRQRADEDDPALGDGLRFNNPEDEQADDDGPFRSGLVATVRAKPEPGTKKKVARQAALNLNPEEHKLPPLDLLSPPKTAVRDITQSKNALEQNAKILATVLDDFSIRGEIVKVRPGPVVTLYELSPAPGTKTSRVIGLSDDIARSMSAVSVRVAVIPGQNVIGIELPNVDREMVYLRELLASDDFEKSKANLPLALGKDIAGAPVTVDLARMPHLLIAGTTGSGKSVAMNTMILSLLYACSPDRCRFIMIDPKMLELSVYQGIPHLLTPVVTEPLKAVVALKWAVREMEDRYRAMSHLGVRNIAGYNMRLEEASKKGEALTRRVQTGFDDEGKPVFEEQPLSMEALPFIVVVVDEMADLMLIAGKDVEAAIQRLAQMARAAGIHLIMATQRPSVDVITGTIKANFPTRISFQVTSKIDSRTILGQQGAEQLLGQGDMLYMAGGGRINRVHGPFVSDDEVENVVSHLKNQGAPAYLDEITIDVEAEAPKAGSGGDPKSDALYDEAVALVTREGKASTSFVQRHLQIGYNRAARIVEQMEREGVVSPANRVGRREVLVSGHST